MISNRLKILWLQFVKFEGRYLHNSRANAGELAGELWLVFSELGIFPIKYCMTIRRYPGGAYPSAVDPTIFSHFD